MFECPFSVNAEMVVAESRGSINMILLFDAPAASRCSCGICSRLKSGFEVVRVSTSVDVVRSHVRSVLSQDVEYPTVGSWASKSAPDTGAECAVNVARGPRCGTVTEELSLRRFAGVVVFGRR